MCTSTRRGKPDRTQLGVWSSSPTALGHAGAVGHFRQPEMTSPQLWPALLQGPKIGSKVQTCWLLPWLLEHKITRQSLSSWILNGSLLPKIKSIPFPDLPGPTCSSHFSELPLRFDTVSSILACHSSYRANSLPPLSLFLSLLLECPLDSVLPSGSPAMATSSRIMTHCPRYLCHHSPSHTIFQPPMTCLYTH